MPQDGRWLLRPNVQRIWVSHLLGRMGFQGTLVVVSDMSAPYFPTGTLQVRLLGCEQLLTTVPGRSPVAVLAGSPSEGWIRARAKQRGGGELASEWEEPGGSRGLCFVLVLSPSSGPTGEVLAVLKVDNRVVGQTSWGQVAEHSWDQTFVIPLERVWLAFVWSGVVAGRRLEDSPGGGCSRALPLPGLPM